MYGVTTTLSMPTGRGFSQDTGEITANATADHGRQGVAR